MQSTLSQPVGIDPTASLVRQCLDGDARAWEKFITLYRPLIHYHCFDLTKSHADAEDLSQDVLLKIFCKLSTFDAQKGCLSHWIRCVTRNHVADHFRRTKLIRATDSLDAGQGSDADGLCMADLLIDQAPTQEQSFARLELQATLRTALKSLSEHSRNVIVLSDLRDLDYKETASMLRIPVGTVKSRLSRGRSELARLLSVTCDAVAFDPAH